ncbi:MAG: ArsR family transcriptional regulator [Candidatus Micrarchaeia archaeon]
MVKDQNINILIESFKNRTKLQIITLLLKNGPMTVTQISKLIHTTRSNLYQVMKDLVYDGIVSHYETKVVKNYVEKFYKLNVDLLNQIKSKDLLNEISKLSTKDIRELIISFLLANSMIFNIIAEETNMMDDKEIEKLREKGIKNMVILSFSTISDESLKKFSNFYFKYIDEVENNEFYNTEKDENLLIIFSFPLFSKFISGGEFNI